MSKVHNLKTWPQFFEPARAGVKPFEVRVNDRDFKVGDIIILEEYYWPDMRNKEGEGRYTGNKLARTITFIFNDPRFCAPGYVVLGLK